MPRKLTEEEKAKAIRKPWVRKPVFSTDPARLRNLQALTGPKTEEGKRKVLDNLIVGVSRPKHGGYVREILTVEEAEVWDYWRQRFEEEFELNSSSDQIVLERILMEKVIEFRLLKAKQEKPTLNIDRAMADNQRRLLEAMEALGVHRKQRIQQSHEAQIDNMAALVMRYATQQARLDEQRQRWREEEEAMAAAKRQQDLKALPPRETEL